MFHKNILRCQQTSSSYLKVSKDWNLVISRSRNKYSGKAQQDFSVVTWEHKNVPDTSRTDFEESEFLPRRLTYMPENLPQHRGKKIKWWDKDRTKITVNVNPVEKFTGYTDKPNYPPIFENSIGFLRQHSETREARIKYYRSLEQMPSFDQKLFELTNLRVLPVMKVSSVARLYNYLPAFNHMTRTHLIDNELPSAYQTDDVKLNELVKRVKPHIFNAIRNHLEFETAKPFFEAKTEPLRSSHNMARLKKNEALVQNINNVCFKHLINDEEYGHLKESITEYNAQVRAWWYASQFPPSKNTKRFQMLQVKTMNSSCQYEDYAPLNIRMNKPLVPILDQSDELINQEVPKFPTNPVKLGFREQIQRISSFPGFLPALDETLNQLKSAERGDFPFLTFMNAEYLNIRNENLFQDFNDNNDVLKAMSVIHNFAYLTALANVHGFTTYSELTYPLTNQMIITDGQNWSFSVYQLNTHAFHSDLPKNGKRNICWQINNVKLYESYQDGKFEGVNDEVIKNLIRMYIQKPKLTESYSELRPHLSVDESSEKEKIEMREDMKRRFGQYRTTKELLFMKSRKVHKFEWVYVRNPVSAKKFLPLMYKQKDWWPVDKVQLANLEDQSPYAKKESK